MSTLATLRARMRLALNDPASASQRFADADLDDALSRAMDTYGLIVPYVRSQLLTSTSGSRIISLSSLTGLTSVLGVRYPWPSSGTVDLPGNDPWRWDQYAGTVVIVGTTVPAGEQLEVTYASAHVVDTSGSTVPASDEGTLLLGATGYACLAYSMPAADNFRYTDGTAGAAVDDTGVAVEWRTRGEKLLDKFEKGLHKIEMLRARGVRARLGVNDPTVYASETEI
jgi:hypothetical protein